MSDRNRLIELINHKQCYGSPVENGVKSVSNETLADYLIANEVKVLPCKVGQIVYVIYPDPRYNWGNKELKILELKVHAFRYFNNKMTVEIRGNGNYITWDISCFGVSVFLTPEEAEKALQGYKENT